jgi:hypothetical protein
MNSIARVHIEEYPDMRNKPIPTPRGRLVLAVAATVAGILGLGGTATAGPFNTFVQSSDINAAQGQTQVIAYNYAGDKFVGSVYFGVNNLQLYSTDLNGKNVQHFGSPLPAGSGEVVIGVSLGLGGFPTRDVYAGSEGSPNIYHYANAGGVPTLFGTLPTGIPRQIGFDTGGLFGGNMIVTTNVGDIYRFNASGTPTLLAKVGEDTEGIDFATSAWGPFAGFLAVASEGSGKLRLISPTGVITDTGIALALLESVNFVPLDLGASDNPLEGLYVANFPVDIQKADASAFAGLQGDAIVSQEFGSNAPFSIVTYNPITGLFSVTPFGNIPNQSEDAIFVTSQRLLPTSVPEPSSLLLLATGGLLATLCCVRRCRRRAA